MSVTVFSWSDFGPESKGLDTKKPQNQLIVCGLSDLVYRVSVVASGAGGI